MGSSGRVPKKRIRPIGLPGSALAGHDAIRPVRLAVGALEQTVDVVQPHRTGAWRPAGVNFAPGADNELLAAHIGDVILRHVVAERPHQLRHRHFRAGRHRAVAGRVELQEPALSRCVLDREARRHAVALRRGDRPEARGRPVARVRTIGNVLERERTSASAVGEPARIRHFVDRVHVPGADATGHAGSLDDVVAKVNEQVELQRLHA